MRITDVNSVVEKEPLLRPYGFKGGANTVGWQVVSLLETDGGHRKVGLGKLSSLWSDAAVNQAHGEAGANALMYAVAVYALDAARRTPFTDPLDLLDSIFPDVYRFGQKITGLEDLRETFVLNAMVALDNAAWLAYAAENGFSTYDEMIPQRFQSTLSARNDRVASLPTISYQTPIDDFSKLVDRGFFFMKIKIGQPGTQEEMLEKDKERLTAIHQVIGGVETEFGVNGNQIPYYWDANGRYEHIDTLKSLIDHADRIGALDQLVLIEEPFPEDYLAEVHDLPVRIASDESAETPADVVQRIELGYTAIAVKPIAKTLSQTLRIAKAAYDRGVPCFAADLTCPPILVDWNKSFVARLPPFPGLGYQFIETNGHQNYANWDRLVSHHPCSEASWIHPKDGMFVLSDEFYERSACLFDTPEYYMNLVS